MTPTRTIVHASIFAALLAGLAGCATLRTSADYDSHADFAGYHTYAVKDVHPGRAAILDHRIKSAVAATLAAKGLHEDAANPDLWVVTHAHVVYEPSPVTWDIGWGWGWPWEPAIGIGRANAARRADPGRHADRRSRRRPRQGAGLARQREPTSSTAAPPRREGRGHGHSGGRDVRGLSSPRRGRAAAVAGRLARENR